LPVYSHQKFPSKIPIKNSHQKFPSKVPICSLQPLHRFAPPYEKWLQPLDRFRLLTAGRGRVAMAGGYGGAMAIEGGEDTRRGRNLEDWSLGNRMGIQLEFFINSDWGIVTMEPGRYPLWEDL